MNNVKKIILLTVFVSFITGCSKLTGQFAFKTSDMDAYRRMETGMEMPVDRPFEWVFKANYTGKKKDLGLVILKKEIVWLDIYKDHREITKASPIIYGKIEDYEKGDYKIIVTEDNENIAEIEFKIYDDNDVGEQE